MYRDIPTDLLALVEPIVADHGLELVDAEFAVGRGPAVVKVIVDTPAGDGRVPVEKCVEVSREIETCIDAEASMPKVYRLEVSSPGLDRPLARDKDFAAACGTEIKLETHRPCDGRRHFRGELLDFAGERLRIRVDGAEVEIPFVDVARANRVYEFTSADFGRKADGGSRRRARRQAARSARSAGSGDTA